jgi:ATP-dependent RNA helicase DeaD
MSTFKSLGVNQDYIKGLNELGIKKPTEIQEKTIPVLLDKPTDFIGLAQTGTGKTAAYGLPLLETIDADVPLIQGLILSPTRELVQQIKKQLFKYTKYLDKKIFLEAVYGGEKIDKQMQRLKRPTHIIIATPGRLIDLIERDVINLRNIKTLVLDEADEMLNMGFQKDLNKILQYTKGKKNTWLFSATMPDEIQAIVRNYMDKDRVEVKVDRNNVVNQNIVHQYKITPLKNKMNTLLVLLDEKQDERGIIFVKTKLGAQKLANELEEEGFSVKALEGDMQQKEREKVMRAFKNGSLQYLVSTDVSARGIDVADLGFVIHYQLPEQREYYTHRSGRTARAGKKGESIALVLPSEMQDIYDLQKKLNIQFQER